MPGNILELGTRFRTIRTQAPQMAFNSGNVTSIELPRSFLYKTLMLRLAGTWTQGTASGAQAENPLTLLKKIEVVADGRKLIVTAAGRDLFRKAHIERGKQPEFSFTFAGGAFSATIPIDFEAVRFVSPVDSFFDPRPYEKVELRITWGTVSDVAQTPGTGALSAVTLDTQVIQTTEGADQVMFNKLISFDEIIPAGASTNLTINCPRSGLLHSILFRTDILVASVITVSDALINFISTKSDNNFLHADRLGWRHQQSENVSAYQIDAGVAGSAQISGYALLDYTEDGLISSTLNVLDLNVLQTILDVSSQTGPVIRMTYTFFEPIASV